MLRYFQYYMSHLVDLARSTRWQPARRHDPGHPKQGNDRTCQAFAIWHDSYVLPSGFQVVQAS